MKTGEEPIWNPQSHEGEWSLFRCDGSWFVGFEGPGDANTYHDGLSSVSHVFCLVALNMPQQNREGQIGLVQHFEMTPCLFLHAVPKSSWRVQMRILISELLEVDRDQIMTMIKTCWANMYRDRASQSGLDLSGKMPPGTARA